jgi:two-component system phosphate regulon sensor histidine kinase PhoR
MVIFVVVKTQGNLIRLIGFIVVVTIGIQVYWNYVQYTNHMAQMERDVQECLEAAVDSYTSIQMNPMQVQGWGEAAETEEVAADSIQAMVAKILEELALEQASDGSNQGEEAISYTIMSNAVDLAVLDSFVQIELGIQKYALTYSLLVIENGKQTDSLGANLRSDHTLKASTPIFPIGSDVVVELQYTNPFWPSLLKGLTGIVLSFILCLAVIFALYYLHRIIQKQKQLSDIKHDFISNVTHEFKTPIATASSALEGVRHFNGEHLSEKSKRYLDISEQQLKKLNQMVERVMETSLLESGALQLHTTPTNLVELVRECVDKFRLNTSKTIELKTNTEHFDWEVDPFHFENALSNLLDNAIKYGGDQIFVGIEEQENGLSIEVSDNGQGIAKEAAPYIFDKFFRDRPETGRGAKGFGIGLYYTKGVIENHGGTIELAGTSTFKIKLWKR